MLYYQIPRIGGGSIDGIGRQIGEGSHEGGTGDKREANAVVVEGDQLG